VKLEVMRKLLLSS